MNWLKKHWLIVLLIALFLFALYTLNAALAKAVALASAALLVFKMLNPVWWIIAVVGWMLGFLFNVLPDWLYSWIPTAPAAQTQTPDLTNLPQFQPQGNAK